MSDLVGVNDTLPVRLGGVSTSSGLPDNYADVTASGDIQANDVTRAAGLDTVITLTGTAIEVKVGASRLITRKYILMNPTGNGVKWGFSSTTQSFDVFKNGFIFFPAGPNTPIWINGTAGITVEIGEV